MREWLAQMTTLETLLIWCCVSQHLMYLHYFFFKTGALHGKLASNGLNGLMSVACMDHRSPVLKVLDILTTGLSGHALFWESVIAMRGPQSGWSQSLIVMASTCLHLSIGTLYRRFIIFFQGWPWKLMGLIDSECSDTSKRKLAQEFLDAPECCRDPLFSERLAKFVKEIEDLVDDLDMIQFLKSIFGGSTSCTTNIENGFARLRRFLGTCWRAPHISYMSWFHIASALKVLHSRFMNPQAHTPGEEPVKKKKVIDSTHMQRPVWAWSCKRRGEKVGCKRGRDVTGRDMHFSQAIPKLRSQFPRAANEERIQDYNARLFSIAARGYKTLPDSQKKSFATEARLENATRNATPDPLIEFIEALSTIAEPLPDSPFGIADKEFPIARGFWESYVATYEKNRSANADQRAMSFTVAKGLHWHKNHGEMIEGKGVLPKNLPLRIPCLMKSTKCLAPVAERHSEKVGTFLSRFEFVVAPKCSSTLSKQLLVRFTVVANHGDTECIKVFPKGPLSSPRGSLWVSTFPRGIPLGKILPLQRCSFCPI